MKASGEIAVVGGGFSGLAAAFELARAGRQVRIFESEAALGGLAGTFEISPGVLIEKFYHHWFTSDTDILGLIQELGLSHRLKRLRSRTGLFYANSIFRLSSPWDLLRFSAIPLVDRVRTGCMALYARAINDWRALEDQSAEEWITRYGGKRAFDAIWRPLLKGKFGPEAEHVSAVWFWNKLKLRGGSRGKGGGEELVYFGGSFGGLVSAIQAELTRMGVVIHTESPVEKVVCQSGRVRALVVKGAEIPVPQALVTVPLPPFVGMVPDLPGDYRAQCEGVRYLGNVCVVLRLSNSLSNTYWLNVADPTFPFVGVIEHTNLDDPQNYGNERIAYLSKYLPTSDSLYQASDDEALQYCLPHLKRMFPEFSEAWVRGFAVWRAPYSQPVITKRYTASIPAHRCPIEGLWLCTMAQVYPEDRGTNYAVREGRKDIPIFKTAREGSARLVPKWLTVNADGLTATISALPARDDIDFTIQENMIVEFYSR